MWADVTGNISGVVRDSSHGLVSHASVSATETSTNFTRTVASDDNGEFRLLALPPGKDTLTPAAGFENFLTTDITLKVNDQLHIDVNLQIGTVKEAVTVEANAVQVETESTRLGQMVDTKQILSLPLNGRSFIDLHSVEKSRSYQLRHRVVAISQEKHAALLRCSPVLLFVR